MYTLTLIKSPNPVSMYVYCNKCKWFESAVKNVVLNEEKILKPDESYPYGYQLFTDSSTHLCKLHSDPVMPFDMYKLNTTEFVLNLENPNLRSCINLKSVIIPPHITEIKECEFSDCVMLESVKLPHLITKIGSRAFAEDQMLTTINLPNSITEIGDNAFEKCKSLKVIKLPSLISELNDSAFRSTTIKNIIIPSYIEIINYLVFCDCEYLKSVVLPNSVKLMYGGVFGRCDSMKSIALPKSLEININGIICECDSSNILIINY